MNNKLSVLGLSQEDAENPKKVIEELARRLVEYYYPSIEWKNKLSGAIFGIIEYAEKVNLDITFAKQTFESFLVARLIQKDIPKPARNSVLETVNNYFLYSVVLNQPFPERIG